MLITSNLLYKMHLSDAIRALHPPLLAEAMAALRRDTIDKGFHLEYCVMEGPAS
jgi:hypothetical protein